MAAKLGFRRRLSRSQRHASLYMTARLLGLPEYELSLVKKSTRENIHQLMKWIVVLNKKLPKSP